ncbi:hypothetical protein [Halosimplex sp. J119]
MSRVNAGGITGAGRRFTRHASRRAFVVELAVAVALLAVAQAYLNLLNLVLDLVRTLASSLPNGQRRSLETVVYSLLAVGGLSALAVAYTSVREVDLGLSMPDREDAPLVALAAAVPAVLAAGFSAATLAASNVSLADIAAADLGAGALFGFLPTSFAVEVLALAAVSALLYHGLVQESLARVADADIAVLATTLVVGVLLREPALLGFRERPLWFTFSEEGVAMAVLFVAALAAVAYATNFLKGSSLRWLAVLPPVLALALAAVWTVNGASTPLELVYNGLEVAVLGLAAYAYDRTESLVTPAVAYLSFAVVDQMLGSALITVWAAQAM